MNGVVDDLAQDVELAFELISADRRVGFANEDLTMERLNGDRWFRQARVVGRDITPTKKLQAFLGTASLKLSFAFAPKTLVAWHENVRHSIFTRFRKFDAQFGTLLLEECMRDLQQQACTVTGKGVGTYGTAVGEVDEDLQGILDNLVRFLCAEIRDETNAAGIVLIARVVETLGARRCSAGGEMLDLGIARIRHDVALSSLPVFHCLRCFQKHPSPIIS